MSRRDAMARDPRRDLLGQDRYIAPRPRRNPRRIGPRPRRWGFCLRRDLDETLVHLETVSRSCRLDWDHIPGIYICQMVPPSCVDATIWVAKCEYFEDGTQVSRPRTQNSLNAGGRNLNKWKLRLMLKVAHASCSGLSLAISAQFALEMCGTAQNHWKIHKKPFFRSKSSKVIEIGSNREPVCNFLTRTVSDIQWLIG